MKHIGGECHLEGALHLPGQWVIDVPLLQGTQSMQGQHAQSAAEHCLEGALHFPRQRVVDVPLLQQGQARSAAPPSFTDSNKLKQYLERYERPLQCC